MHSCDIPLATHAANVILHTYNPQSLKFLVLVVTKLFSQLFSPSLNTHLGIL